MSRLRSPRNIPSRVARFAAGLIYGVSPTDPAAMMASGVVVFSIALAAALAPARQASRINPVDAMRCD